MDNDARRCNRLSNDHALRYVFGITQGKDLDKAWSRHKKAGEQQDTEADKKEEKRQEPRQLSYSIDVCANMVWIVDQNDTGFLGLWN
ncbi:TPA: hypothetical protein ACH3X1_001627 [Trebouxia sp. C0004]